MSRYCLREIRTRQFGQHSLESWRWTLVADAEGAVRALVQDGAPDTNIYAIGAVLSPQARLIAELGPPVLAEVAAAQENALDAAEQLEFLADVLKRLLSRAYRLGHGEHYADLRTMTRGIAAALVSLKGLTLDSKRLLDALELAEIRSRDGVTAGLGMKGAVDAPHRTS